MARTDRQINLRLPKEVYAFVSQQAQLYGSSLSSEVTRAIKERMDRQTKTATE
ncbi:Arc-like DNA binding domain-containing protein [Phyllobacterium sp. OV277]|nr:Arc-like DNA binding domain-containing protein [Phyllobacterium sp. OV277]